MATITANTQYYMALVALWVISTFLLRSLFKKSSTTIGRRVPPSPPSLPIIGHLHHFTKDYYRSLQKIGIKYGPIISLRLGLLPVVHISSASVVSEIFKTNDVLVSGKPKDPLFGCFKDSGIVATQYGEYWRFMKKLCMTEVLSSSQIQRTRAIRYDELTRILYKIVDKASKNEAVNLSSELMKLTNANISRMSLSTKHSEDGSDGDDADAVRQLVVDLNNLAGKVKLSSLLGPFRIICYWMLGKQDAEVTGRFDALLDRIMEEHEEKAKREGPKREKDLMDILLDIHYDEKAELKITKVQIKAFLRDIIMRGTTTLSDTIQWAIAEVVNRPKVFNRIRNEIESVVGKNRLVEESDIPDLHYLQAVVKETLRLYAAIPVINRATNEDFKIAGFDLPKGTILIFNAYAILRDPNVWENPDEFIPERFFDNKEGYKQNFNYIPFGMGRRSCPGSNLALASTHVVVAAMVQCFDWKVGGEKGDEGKISTKVGFSITTSMARELIITPKVYSIPFAAKV